MSLDVLMVYNVHVMWTRLSFSDISSYELLIQQQIDVILDRFKEVDIGDKVTIKSKLRESAYLDDINISTIGYSEN